MPAPAPDVGRAASVDSIAVDVTGRAGPGAQEEPRGEWPLRPRPPVAAQFEAPTSRWGAGHRGVDLVGRTGQQVRAALPGRVSFVGHVAGMPVVVVDHGGTRTTYQPVVASVARGDEVAAGAVIGSLQWAGSHCSPAACLHWGWVRGTTYLDPLELVDAPRPVRLLPL